MLSSQTRAVGVTPQQRIRLVELARSPGVSRRVARRAQLILEMSDGGDFAEVARRVGVGRTAVRRWCHRWHDARPLLEEAEGTLNRQRALDRIITEILAEAPALAMAPGPPRGHMAAQRRPDVPGNGSRGYDMPTGETSHGGGSAPRGRTRAYSLVWIPAATFMLVLAAGILVAKIYDDSWHKDQATAGAELAAAYSLAIERHLNRSLSAAYILGSMVTLHDLDAKDFRAHAADLIRSIGGISRLKLAPHGVIRQVYPESDAAPSLGQDILQDAERSREAYLAVVTERLTLAGPAMDEDGAAVVIGTYPVFRKGARGEVQFWGFVLVEIRVDRVVVDSGIPQLTDKGYVYKLSQVDPDSGITEILAGERDRGLSRPISYRIPLPNKHWLLTISPRQEFAHGPLFGLLLAIALAVSALVSSTVFVLLRQPVLLRRVVAERTRQLEAENHERRLAEQRARESERRFQHLAQHDELTGLPNRLLFRDRLDQSLLHARRNKSLVALMFIDLDNFKPVNDELGHDAGDMLLRQVAERVPDCVRSSDTVARIGGDEFTVILAGLHSAAAAAVVARKIVTVLARPFEVQGHTVHIGCSLGIALFPNHGLDAERLMRSADAAMYRAKEQGRGSYRFGDDAGRERAGGNGDCVGRAADEECGALGALPGPEKPSDRTTA